MAQARRLVEMENRMRYPAFTNKNVEGYRHRRVLEEYAAVAVASYAAYGKQVLAIRATPHHFGLAMSFWVPLQIGAFNL